MANEDQMSEAELEAATAPTPPTPPVVPDPDPEPTTGAPRTHSAADAQSLNVEDYRPEPGTATFTDDRNGEEVVLDGVARSAVVNEDNFKQEFPKRHVTPPRDQNFEPESGLDMDTVAEQVNAGLWGSGQDRRILLDRFGYDPNEVQAASVALRNRAQQEADNHGLS